MSFYPFSCHSLVDTPPWVIKNQKREVSGLFGSHGGGSPSLGHLLHIGGGGEGVIILPWFIRHCASVGGGVVSGLFGSRGVSGMFSACRVGGEIS